MMDRTFSMSLEQTSKSKSDATHEQMQVPNGAKVLIVEDDETLLSVLKYSFTKEGYTVLTAEDGVKALDVARSGQPDLIVLDIMLPKLDGVEVCRTLRKEMSVPILMLTARVEEIDKIVGLELGADDYVTKPFGMRELLARVKALLRRVRELALDVVTAMGGSTPVHSLKASAP